MLIYDYIISLVNLYGLVHKRKVIEIYNQQNKDQIDIEEMDEIMYNDSDELHDHFVYIDGDYFVTEGIIVFDEVEMEIDMRAGKPFYIPPKKELLKYKDEYYFEKTKYYRALFRYVKKHFTKGDEQRTIDICEDIQFMCKHDFAPGKIFNRLNQLNIIFDGEEQVGEVVNLVMDLSNNTRLPVNNGFTPNELSAKFEMPFMQELPEKSAASAAAADKKQQPVVVQKIGRNDPCPCGSGKKYKRCCLE